MTTPSPPNILVIKLGALGDFIQATAAFAAIRAAHPQARITLLTTKAMLPLTKNNPFFNDIRLDPRGKLYNPCYLRTLRKLLHQENSQKFDFVYDLQTNDRTKAYFFLAQMPSWSGITPFCSHPHTNPARNHMHTLDRLQDQLAAANVALNPAEHKPNVLYAAGDATPILTAHNLKEKQYVCLIPGGSAHRPEKRWPHFAAFAKRLAQEGYTPVLIGGKDEETLLKNLETETNAVNLCGKTNLNQLIDILKKSTAAIGNDTGPTHLAAATLTPTIVLFGSASNPNLCAPKGENIGILQEKDIQNITTQTVFDVFFQKITKAP